MHGGGLNTSQKNWPIGMNARSNFKAGIAYDDLCERLALADAEPRLPPEKRAADDMTHSVAVINACKSYHWRNKFPPSNAPSAEIARKARERFGWLLDGASES